MLLAILVYQPSYLIQFNQDMMRSGLPSDRFTVSRMVMRTLADGRRTWDLVPCRGGSGRCVNWGCPQLSSIFWLVVESYPLKNDGGRQLG